MAEKLFTRIAYSPKAEVVELEWQERRIDGEADKHTAEMHEPPHEHFLRAFRKLSGHAITICELKGIDPSEVEVRSVSLRHKDERLGVTIHAVRPLKTSNTPMNIQTPLKWTAQGSDGEDTTFVLSDFAEECLQDLADEALLYLEGEKRGPAKQTDAFEDTSGKDGVDEEEGVEQGELVGAGAEA